jgi:hypothetical protein
MRANALARAGGETVIGSEWGASKEEISIGRDVLELVSSAMYVDPRRSIGNTSRTLPMRSMRHANWEYWTRMPQLRGHQHRLGGTDGAPSGQWDRCGVIAFALRLTSLGASPKRGLSSRGFRGVGRLAGLAYCQELIFRSRAKGEREVSELRWDCPQLKSALRRSDGHADLQAPSVTRIQLRRWARRERPLCWLVCRLRNRKCTSICSH